MADMDAISASLNALLATYGITRDQIADLLGGAADGGPNGDGNYPVTLESGATVLVPSPRRLAALSGDVGSAVAVIQPILDAAKLARDAAVTAAQSVQPILVDLAQPASKITVISTDLAQGANSKIGLVAAGITNINSVAANIGAIGTVAGKIENVGIVAGGIVALNAVATDLALGAAGSFILRAPKAAADAEVARAAAAASALTIAGFAGTVKLQAPAGYAGGFADGYGRYTVLIQFDGGWRFAKASIGDLSASKLAIGNLTMRAGAPVGYVQAWGDMWGRYTVGIKTTGELAASRIVGVRSINGKTWSEIAAGGSTATAATARTILDAEINMACFYGQSKPAGTASFPILSTIQNYDGLRFSDGVRVYDQASPARNALVPLIETADPSSGNTLGETPASAMNAVLKERLVSENQVAFADRRYQMLMTCEARGGSPGSALKVGTAPYNAILADYDAMRVLAQTAGRTSKFRSVHISHGESDYGNVSAADHRANWLAVVAGINAYVKTGSPNANPSNGDVIAFWDQVFAHATYGSPNNPYLALEQAAICREVAGHVMVGNLAHLPNSTYPHWTNIGSYWAGAYHARAYKRVVIERGVWKPLAPVDAYRDGKMVMLRFEPESGQIVLDGTANAGASYGLTLADSAGTAIAINSVSPVGKDTIMIVAASTIPAGSFVRNGYPAGGRTGVRDTMGDAIKATAPNGQVLPLHNYCLIFNQTLA